jgi:ATP-binding cassette subfamily G (WHITE) protein 2 (SNQ2)
MWGSSLIPTSSQDQSRNPWHREDRDPEETARPRLETADSEETRNASGTWGERDAGGLDRNMAMEDFEALRQTLSSLSKTKSQSQSVRRPISRKSTHRTGFRKNSVLSDGAADDERDVGTGPDEKATEEKEDDFELSEFMKEGHFEKRKNGQSAKKVGVVWRNLTVKGVGSTASFVRTLPNAVLGTFGPDLYKIISGYIPALKFGKVETRILINDFSGVVRDGEMMLVLGRPGSGCSTFLKAIANNRESYAGVDGQVSYGGIPADKQKKRFRGEVNYNPEDDTHFASLNVWQTLYFALMMKTKKKDQSQIPVILEALLRIFGISHTKYTPVGDEYIRGVSGGERKRVSTPVSESPSLD